MRFWLTACVGIVVISGFSSAVYVYYPEAFGFGKAEPLVPTTAESPVAKDKLPLLEFDRQKEEIDKVPQFQEGTTVYHLRNDGQGDLLMELGSKSCGCAAIRIDKGGKTLTRFAKSRELEDAQKKLEENRKEKVSEAVEGMGNIDPGGKVTLGPGESADFVIEWDTKDYVGVKTVTGTLLTTDARSDRREVEFVVRLNVLPELVVDPVSFSFGQLRDGQERQESVRMYSLRKEDLSIEFLSATSPAITVAVRPMNEQELSATKAKSGFVATATVKGRLPVGDYAETVIFGTNLPQQKERRVGLTGFVNGDIEVHPGRVYFETVSQAGGATKRVSISAPVLGKNESLRIDEKRIQVEPNEDIVGVTIARQEEFSQVWTVQLFIKPSKHVGRFKAWVPIVDSQGQERVTIFAEGNLAAGK